LLAPLTLGGRHGKLSELVTVSSTSQANGFDFPALLGTERHPGVTAGIVLFRDLHGPPDALGPNRYHGTGCIAYHFDRNPYHPKLLLQKSRYLIVIYTACAADR
jgi:hypothetical protein